MAGQQALGGRNPVSSVVHALDIAAGPFVAYARTDGRIAICDQRLELGRRTVRVVNSPAAARVAVDELARGLP